MIMGYKIASINYYSQWRNVDFYSRDILLTLIITHTLPHISTKSTPIALLYWETSMMMIYGKECQKTNLIQDNIWTDLSKTKYTNSKTALTVMAFEIQCLQTWGKKQKLEEKQIRRKNVMSLQIPYLFHVGCFRRQCVCLPF